MALSRLLSSKLALAGVCTASALALLPAVAGADPGHFRGVITKPTPAGRAFKAKVHPARRGVSNLNYYGGPVMHNDANYAIYWTPGSTSLPLTYTSLIGTYFKDVAAADGATSNVYAVARQYHDTTGSGFSYGATAGSTYTDTDPYPASGCRAAATCITDAQLQTEVDNFVGSRGLPRGLGTMYFVYFPAGVATCFDSSGSQCSTNVYCAYHSSFGSASNPTLYANMPYAGVSGCETGESPNGTAAGDSALNVTSHENIEGITDPLGNAWYDSSGNEIGDKCNFTFGSPLGGALGAEYNQAISSGKFYLQEEWSNAGSGCVQHA